jgi:hypothetical protein
MKWKAPLDRLEKMLRFLEIKPVAYNEQDSFVITIDKNFHKNTFFLDLKNITYDYIIITIPEALEITIEHHEVSLFNIKKIMYNVQAASRVVVRMNIHTEDSGILLIEGRVQEQAFLDIQVRLKVENQDKIGLDVQQIHEGIASWSNCNVKGLINGQARWWCENMILIKENAIQSQAEQKTHALLLGDHARFHGVPALEVLNHEVQCKHGSAVGYINDENRFYLMARGLTVENAERLIIEGFLT